MGARCATMNHLSFRPGPMPQQLSRLQGFRPRNTGSTGYDVAARTASVEGTTTMTSELPVVVFSDVDGVLCDPHTHAFADAARALSSIDDTSVALVLCSNKTRAEIESLQQALGIHHPFVCESGGAAFVPAGYFGFDLPHARDIAGYQAVEFGRPHAEIAQALRRIAARLQVEIHAFSDMSVDEVARETRLSLLQARLAKLPEYGERFCVRDRRAGARGRLIDALNASHLRCVAA